MCVCVCVCLCMCICVYVWVGMCIYERNASVWACWYRSHAFTHVLHIECMYACMHACICLLRISCTVAFTFSRECGIRADICTFATASLYSMRVQLHWSWYVYVFVYGCENTMIHLVKSTCVRALCFFSRALTS
jgi:hypothetical protein